MAGTGRTPKAQAVRRNTSAPQRGEWSSLEQVGWQHGEVPAPPDGLMPASLDAWSTWMGSWIAAHWCPEDLAGLRHLIRLYDQVERGDFPRMTEVRLLMDTFGLTPKGRQDRRWAPPAGESSTTATVRQVRPRRLKSA